MKETILNIAGYIARRYREIFGEDIDEMKLHKLLYFAQRESFIRYDRPLFDEILVAGKYGPLSIPVRDAYKANVFSFTSLEANKDLTVSEQFVEENQQVFNPIFSHYAPMDSWDLSAISHGEQCWEIARKGVHRFSYEYRDINTEDIRLDADYAKKRREFLAKVFPNRPRI